MKISANNPINLHDQFRKAKPMLKSGDIFNPLGSILKNIRERTDEEEVKTFAAQDKKRNGINLRI
jgi:hypothetical protein